MQLFYIKKNEEEEEEEKHSISMTKPKLSTNQYTNYLTPKKHYIFIYILMVLQWVMWNGYLCVLPLTFLLVLNLIEASKHHPWTVYPMAYFECRAKKLHRRVLSLLVLMGTNRLHSRYKSLLEEAHLACSVWSLLHFSAYHLLKFQEWAPQSCIHPHRVPLLLRCSTHLPKIINK